jgi:uncharacterized protein YegJ (DUF2314 family)
MKIIRITLILLLFSSLAIADPDERDRSEIIDVYETDIEMNNAIQKARDTLQDYINRLKNPQENDSDFALKVQVEDENGVEHFWVSEVEINKDGFIGYIANEPKLVKSVKYGEKVSFNKDIITDWSYDINGVRQGSYTLRVLLGRMSKNQAAYYRKQVGW